MSRQALTIIICAFVLGVAGCGDTGSDPPPDPPPGTASPSTTDAVLIDTDGKVGCLAETAFAADNANDTADKVTPCDTNATGKDFKKGSVVTTDAVGEAYVEIPPSCRVHVFRNSTLEKSACPKGGTGGNACVANGTVAFNGCSANLIIGTPSATITLEGTWVTVSYVPDLELTQVDVLRGAASVTPVTDIDTGAVDSVVNLAAGQSVYTATDAFIGVAEVVELEGDARTPVATLDLYVQAFDSNLTYVAYVPTLSQAAQDGVLSADFVNVAERSPWVLRVAAPGLEDPGGPGETSEADITLLEAVELGVDWGAILDETGVSVFTPAADSLRESSPLEADGTVNFAAPLALEFTRLLDMPFDQGAAVARLRAMPTDEPDVIIVVPGRSRSGIAAANLVAAYFKEIGLFPIIRDDFATDVDALVAYNRLVADGFQVISITQR